MSKTGRQTGGPDLQPAQHSFSGRAISEENLEFSSEIVYIDISA